MGKRHELFSIFFIEKELFAENVKNGVRGNECLGRTVQPTQLIRISVEAEFCALQIYKELFFSNFTLVFESNHSSEKMHFCLKKLNSRRRIFFRIRKKCRSQISASSDTSIIPIAQKL